MQVVDVQGQGPSYDYARKRDPDVPYIGITGFSSGKELTSVIDQYYKYRRSDHVLMAGILVSKSVLDAGIHENAKKRTRYPCLEKIPEILENGGDELVMRTIHYSTREPERLYDDVVHMLEDLGWKGMVEAFQFNVKFPPVEREIASIVSRYPGIKIITQVNRGAMEAYPVKQIGSVFASMHDPGNYVLIDPSGGRGDDIDMTKSMEYHAQIKKNASVTIGFAGGFSPVNVAARVKRYKKLVGSTSFCIDAEGKLRDDLDSFDTGTAVKYMKNFFEAIISK
jgi:hypothetical protein